MNTKQIRIRPPCIFQNVFSVFVNYSKQQQVESEPHQTYFWADIRHILPPLNLCTDPILLKKILDF